MGLIHTFGDQGIITPGPSNASAAKAKVVSDTAANTWCTPVEFFAASALLYPVYGVTITPLQEASSVLMARMIEVMVGASGSEKTLIPRVFERDATFDQVGHTPRYFPIYIPAGTRISVRTRQDQTGSLDHAIHLNLHHIGLPFTDSFHNIEVLGTTVDASNTKGTVFTPATGSSWGSWVAMLGSGASGVLLHGAKAISIVMGTNNNNCASSEKYRFQIGVGASGSQKVIAEFCATGYASSANIIMPDFWGPYPTHIPVGSEVWIRCQATVTTTRDAVAYAMS